MGSGPSPGRRVTAVSTRSWREMVCRVRARREETTTAAVLSADARALSASRRQFTASSKAGGRSRNETPTSAKTDAGGRPLSHTRSSSANCSGPETRMRADFPLSISARATAAATIGHAERGSRATWSSLWPRATHPSSRGSAPSAACHNVVMAAPRIPALRRGCSDPSPARSPLGAPAPARRRPH